MVENMSGFVCPHCNQTSHVFGSGGANKMANELDVDVLGMFARTHLDCVLHNYCLLKVRYHYILPSDPLQMLEHQL